ncbi:hypothetical protein Tco_1150646 [Tanacetum coccineum]
MAPLPSRAERHLWLRYEDQEYTYADIHDFEDRLGRIYDRRVHRIHVLYFEELTEEIDQALRDRLRIDHTGARQFIMALALHTTEEIDTEGFIAYWDKSSRMGEVKHLRRYADGRKQGAKMSRGYFITRLAEHFRLITIESLRGLTIVVCDLTMIDMDELVRLHICERLLGIPNWVAIGLERQQAGAVAEAAHVEPKVAEEGIQADLTPDEAAQEEVRGLRDSVGEQRIVLDEMSRDFVRFTTWPVDRLGKLLDASRLSKVRQYQYDVSWGMDTAYRLPVQF